MAMDHHNKGLEQESDIPDATMHTTAKSSPEIEYQLEAGIP